MKKEFIVVIFQNFGYYFISGGTNIILMIYKNDIVDNINFLIKEKKELYIIV